MTANSGLVTDKPRRAQPDLYSTMRRKEKKLLAPSSLVYFLQLSLSVTVPDRSFTHSRPKSYEARLQFYPRLRR